MEEEATLSAHKPSPEAKAYLPSLVTWRWLDPFITLGNQRPVKMEDLYDLNSKETASYCELRWNQCMREEKSKKIWKILLRFLGKDYFMASLLLPLWLGLLILQVYVLKAILALVQLRGELQWWWAAILVLAMFLLPMLQSISYNYMFYKCYKAGIRVRAAVSMAIFNKMSSVRMVSFSGSAASQMMNIIGNDTLKLVEAVSLFHNLWMVALNLLVITSFLVVEAGLSALPGIALIFLAQPLQMKVADRIKAFRKKAIPVTDTRVEIANEVLMGIKAVKFNGWTPIFLKKLDEVRSVEIGWISKVSYLRALMSTFRDGSIPLACVATFGVYAARHGNTLVPATGFAVLAFYSVLGRFFLAVFAGLSYLAESLVTVERIQRLLNSDDDLSKTEKEESLDELQENGSSPVDVSHCTFSWGDLVDPKISTKALSPSVFSGRPVLEDITFTVKHGEHVAITGRIGSGKSSLLLGLLGEMKVLAGSYSVPKRVAYAPQQPWIINASVRENIIFGKNFDEGRYGRVVSACALETDFMAWSSADSTEIGERGINLSGGQKARLSLARACYDQASVVFLDDPFSAVDVPTASHLIREVLGGILKGRTVIVATHSLMCLQACDRVYHLAESRLHLMPKEQELTPNELDMKAAPMTSPDKPASRSGNFDDKDGALVMEETTTAGDVTLWSYLKYARMAGRTLPVAVVIIFMLGQAPFVMVDYWLRVWTDQKYHLPKNYYVIVFTAFAFAACLSSVLRASLFYKAALTAASSMHKVMTEKVLRSPTVFFDQNPVGRILNRFTNDQAIVDDTFPFLSQQGLEYLAACLGGVVIIGILIPWFLLAIPPFLLALAYFRQRYVSVCCELKSLDAVSRSPVYAHFSETLQGAVSVRAYRAQARFHNRFLRLVDTNHQTVMMYLHATRWLGIRMDFVTAVCITSAALLVVLLRHKISPGLAGVIMVQSFKMTGVFSFAIRISADVENYFSSVQRIQEYCCLPTEADPDTKPGLITEDWPSKGGIAFVNYTMAYREELAPVLKNIKFEVDPMAKIGIVGRTGAGKSSLVSAIFRMVESSACSGSIVVDGIDIKSVGLDDLRQRLSIIPQEPVLFSGTIRFNLDPFGKYSDYDIRDALERAHLLRKIENISGGLDGRILDNGKNYSIGEKQLFCLGRSLLRRSKILVLDEATASVDKETDQQIQSTIREYCRACTVLTIAHRIDTIIDADRVLVLGKGGYVAEFDTPLNLINTPGGIFQSMIAQTGKTTAAELMKTASWRALSSSECSL